MNNLKIPYEDQLAMLSPEERANREALRNSQSQAYFDGEEANPTGEGSPLVGQKYNNSDIQTSPESIATPTPSDIPSAQALQQAKYEKMLADIKAAQEIESSKRTNIDMLRGGNQIAQAMASGYGGKIGDGSAQADALTKSASEPTENLLKQYKMQKDATTARQSPYGFGAFTNKKGEPLVMLPDGTAWNVVQKREHRVDEGVIPRAVEKLADNKMDGTQYGWKPGIDPVRGSSAPINQGATNEKVNPDGTVEKLKPTFGDYKSQGIVTPNEVRDIINKDKEGFEQSMQGKLVISSSLDAIENLAKSTLTNSNLASALGGMVGSLFDPGKQTDQDAIRFIQQYGLQNKIAEWSNWLTSDTLRPKAVAEIVKTAKDYRKTIDGILSRKALAMAQASSKGLSNKTIEPQVLADFYFQPSAQVSETSNSVTIQLPDNKGTRTIPKEAWDNKYSKDPRYKIVQ